MPRWNRNPKNNGVKPPERNWSKKTLEKRRKAKYAGEALTTHLRHNPAPASVELASDAYDLALKKLDDIVKMLVSMLRDLISGGKCEGCGAAVPSKEATPNQKMAAGALAIKLRHDLLTRMPPRVSSERIEPERLALILRRLDARTRQWVINEARRPLPPEVKKPLPKVEVDAPLLDPPTPAEMPKLELADERLREEVVERIAVGNAAHEDWKVGIEDSLEPAS